MPKVIVKPHIQKQYKVITSIEGINIKTDKIYKAIRPLVKTFNRNHVIIKAQDQWLEFNYNLFEILKKE